MSELLVGIESLKSAHRAFLGEQPSDDHLRVYESFPSCRGVSGSEKDTIAFEATVIMALVQTFPKHQRPTPFKCYFFVPASMDKWALETLGTVAKRMFEVLKGQRKVAAAKELGKLYHHVLMGSRVLQLNEEPDRWVAFGFEKNGIVPDWLSPRLLTRTPAT